MREVARRLETGVRTGFRWLDVAMNRLYGSRVNPLYHSGAIAVALLGVLLVTGLYLLLFYRVGAPYASVERMTGQAWLGRWVRTLHRYAADAVVVAVSVHALRMFSRGKSWGPRVLAWISGLVLFGVLLVCGWTGYVMIWDAQAQLLAVEGARFMDVLPIFSEPIGRAFVGERPLPSAFFFLNLFLHVALPIGVGLLLWVHVSRVARPKLLPSRRLLWGMVGVLAAASVVWPIGMAPEANLFRLPGETPIDVFYAFWLPFTRALPAGAVWVVGGAVALVALLAPLWLRPPAAERPAPAVSDEHVCTGCEQCYHDCPYEAIRMVERADGRNGLAARVDATVCVSCGICAGSCAPMVVGPPGRTGRDQLASVEAMIASREPGASDIVMVGCDRSALASVEADVDASVFAVECAGSLHTSVVEYLVRAGAGGVLIVACPVSDCWNREGARWLERRLFYGREAELRERVDRSKVRLVHAAATEPRRLRRAITRFRKDIARFEHAEQAAMIDRAFWRRPGRREEARR